MEHEHIGTVPLKNINQIKLGHSVSTVKLDKTSIILAMITFPVCRDTVGS